MTTNENGLREGEIDIINSFTRRKLAPEEVFVFSLVLCDNEIDRDHERFSEDALKKLETLFCGVTGVTDHDPKAGNQTARIFSCRTEKVPGKKTSYGEDYVRLTARAYMPRTDGNSEFLMQLDSGIKKEVSVGCSVAKRICSICGCENGSCGHVRGRTYDGKLCYMTLDEPTDAYEWSFVAVPAQKGAGVIKSFKKGAVDNMDIEKRLFSGTAQSFTADELNILADNFRTLKEKAADGEAYRRKLEADISKQAAFALPQLKRDTLDFMTRKMSAVQLEDLCRALCAKAAKNVPLRPQLCAEDKKDNKKYNDYKNI